MVGAAVVGVEARIGRGSEYRDKMDGMVLIYLEGRNKVGCGA